MAGRQRIVGLMILNLRPHIIARRARSTGSRQCKRFTTSDAAPAGSRTKNFAIGTTIVVSLILGYGYVTDTRASVHRWLVVPALRRLCPDPEEAHEAGTKALKSLYAFGLHPRERDNLDKSGDLAVEVFGHTLANPIGISAGLDKNAEIPTPLFALGPAVVEVGGVTPRPQEGNPKPRVFRIVSQSGLINRYGLNSHGVDAVAMRLRQRVRQYAYANGFGLDEQAEQAVLDGEANVPPGSLTFGKLLAVQLGKNASTPVEDIEAVKRDFVIGVETVGRYADIITINVSSPNTAGLRGLQQTQPLKEILGAVVHAANRIERRTKPVVMVKVSPDEDGQEQVEGISEAVWTSGVAGVIVGNTTTKRPGPLHPQSPLSASEAQTMLERGGYSGPQLFAKTVDLVKKYRQVLDRGAYNFSKDTPLESDTPARDEVEDPKTAADAQQPLLRLPERHQPTSAETDKGLPTSSSQPLPPAKIIFATGGVTNGKEALELLNAGSNLAFVYTTMVYGGSGTITRIKQEMREELARSSPRTKS